METNKRIVFGLVVSILLNVFLLGVFAGQYLFARHRASGRPLAPVANVQALPERDRLAFRHAMQPHRQDIRAARARVVELRQAAQADLVASDFDRDKIAKDLGALREANAQLQDVVQGALVDALGVLDLDARKAVVTRARR